MTLDDIRTESTVGQTDQKTVSGIGIPACSGAPYSLLALWSGSHFASAAVSASSGRSWAAEGCPEKRVLAGFGEGKAR